MTKAIRLLGALGIFATGYLAGTRGETPTASAAQGAANDQRVFELRTYTAHPGKQADVERRFREHTTYLFDKHGMKNVAYFVPTDTPLAANTLIYIIAHPSREAAARNWASFRADSAWIRARTASEANGPIVQRTQSVFMKATDFSPIQ
jgi:hypothetical protein